jgi:hypothetical protein
VTHYVNSHQQLFEKYSISLVLHQLHQKLLKQGAAWRKKNQRL